MKLIKKLLLYDLDKIKEVMLKCIIVLIVLVVVCVMSVYIGTLLLVPYSLSVIFTMFTETTLFIIRILLFDFNY